METSNSRVGPKIPVMIYNIKYEDKYILQEKIDQYKRLSP